MASARHLPLTQRVRDRRAAHKSKPLAVRAAVVLAGLTVTLAGVAMMVLPGPAIAVIPAGLALLALEFTVAERALAKAESVALSAKDAAIGGGYKTKRVLVTAAVLAAGAALITAAVLLGPEAFPHILAS